MLNFNQINFLQDLNKLLDAYHIERFEIHDVDPNCSFVAFYSNGAYLGISAYYHEDFHGIRTYLPEYKITGGEAPNDT